MRKRTTGWVFALFIPVLVLLNGTAAHGIEVDGTICLQATSSLTGITHTLNLSFLAVPSGQALLFGASCYVIPAGNGSPGSDDCVAVQGSGILFEGKGELALHGVENQTDFGHEILTVSNTHIWITNFTPITGTWAAESITYIEGGAQDVQQFDKGTVLGCPS